eukprot:Pompholyxophrys_punicea_v1_NODE_317_length_2277_cov_3.387663.p4 type:complete len:102 gc:universal NODE_317_length_2277_cov_3.387663:888-583(-)
MIASVYNSRAKGAKSFERNGVKFGWTCIEAMCEREYRAASNNLMMDVPKLQVNHVYRDSWTRLNVTPAKIFPQRTNKKGDVIAALRGYASTALPQHPKLRV